MSKASKSSRLPWREVECGNIVDRKGNVVFDGTFRSFCRMIEDRIQNHGNELCECGGRAYWSGGSQLYNVMKCDKCCAEMKFWIRKRSISKVKAVEVSA